MMKKILTLSLMMVLTAAMMLAKDVEVSGEAVYYDDGRHSRVECERLALEQARINALAKAFGTSVTQSIVQSDQLKGSVEVNNFLALSETEVRGEWLGDISTPIFEYGHDKDNNFVVTCKVRGKARALSNEAVNFETSALRNGMFSSHASSNFRNGDQMYVYFLGSSDGYISVFLEDESRTVYNLLPYPRDTAGEVRVKKYQEYIFFSPEKGNGKFGPEEELIMTADGQPEYNRLYVVFSPERFSIPVMHREGDLPAMKSDDFTRWLLRTRHNDTRMNVKTINLVIEP